MTGGTRSGFLLALGLLSPSLAHSQSPLSVRQLHHASWSLREGVPSAINAITQAADGFLWLGTATGLYRFDGVRFEPFEPAPSRPLPGLVVAQLLALPDTVLWMGYQVGGVSRYARGQLTHYGTREGLPEGTITAIARDSSGIMWVATTTGLARLQGSTWQKIGPESGYPGGMTTDLLVDRRGTLWAPNPAGVFVLPVAPPAW